ncbi:hypothetical protein ES689_06155 [Frigoribacterium sp. ACAM 257]|uniref:NaeI family type II restriction endonuclease n=1 Tax=Frigoribacterium sp. ACAM 257 TaxID=2508998 RepID=UPI0011B96C49|nr:hypothetical protein ES689_06155 [Frigoribacterium sp. ACAM 257]
MTASAADDLALFDDGSQPAADKKSARALAGSSGTRRARPSSPDPARWPEPTWKSRARRTPAVPPTPDQDPEVHRIRDCIEAADPEGIRCGRAIRQALDQTYDGRRTGRWDLTQLTKAETVHIGSLIEVWLQRVFDLSDGVNTSLQVAGYDVACTWSERINGWTLDRAYSREHEVPVLVVWANEETSRFSIGVLRPGPESRGMASMDRGRPRLSQTGIDQILWIFDGAALPANILVKHPAIAMEAVLQLSGQSAVNTLFRRLQGELIPHAAVETVAQQIDSSKRIRDARRDLKNEGIVILGPLHPQPKIAAALGLPLPQAGSFVSHRLAPMKVSEVGIGAEIGGRRWRLATASDSVTTAPTLPVQGKERA